MLGEGKGWAPSLPVGCKQACSSRAGGHTCTDVFTLFHPHASRHNQLHTCACTLTLTYCHMLQSRCHDCEQQQSPLPMCRPRYICPGPHLGSPDALSSPGLSPTHQVLGWLGQDGKGGQVLALAAGVSRLGLQGLAALSVPVPRVGISWRRERWHEPRAQLCDPKATAGSPKMCS